jgi:hypothetical protein
VDTLWTTALPTWLVGVGTIGAFATGWAVLLREVSRDHERDLDLQRRQASSVAAWPTHIKDTSSAISAIRTRLTLSNASSEPVYNITIRYSDKQSQQIIQDQLDFLEPGINTRELPDQLQETWLKTDDGWVKKGAAKKESITDPHKSRWAFDVGLSFTDASGRRWSRDSNGSLHQLKLQ